MEMKTVVKKKQREESRGMGKCLGIGAWRSLTTGLALFINIFTDSLFPDSHRIDHDSRVDGE